MELVDGETLEARFSRGPLAIDEARRVGIQIAEAFFSPNSEWLGFFTTTALKKVKISGGAPTTLTAVNTRGRVDAPLQRMAASGGEATRISRLDALGARSHRFPVWVGGRQSVLFEVRHPTTSATASNERAC